MSTSEWTIVTAQTSSADKSSIFPVMFQSVSRNRGFSAGVFDQNETWKVLTDNLWLCLKLSSSDYFDFKPTVGLPYIQFQWTCSVMIWNKPNHRPTQWTSSACGDWITHIELYPHYQIWTTVTKIIMCWPCTWHFLLLDWWLYTKQWFDKLIEELFNITHKFFKCKLHIARAH